MSHLSPNVNYNADLLMWAFGIIQRKWFLPSFQTRCPRRGKEWNINSIHGSASNFSLVLIIPYGICNFYKEEQFSLFSLVKAISLPANHPRNTPSHITIRDMKRTNIKAILLSKNILLHPMLIFDFLYQLYDLAKSLIWLQV